MMNERLDLPQENGIRLELLVGRKLVDSNGRRVGRIKEFIADRGASECFLEAVLVAPRRIVDVLWLIVSALGKHHDPEYTRIEWRLIDVSDPRHPRLRCSREEAESAMGNAECEMRNA